MLLDILRVLLQLLLCGGRRRWNDSWCELVLRSRKRCHRASSHLWHSVKPVIWRESWRCLDDDGSILLLLLLFTSTVFVVARLFALLRG